MYSFNYALGKEGHERKKATLLSHVSLLTRVPFGHPESHIQLATSTLQPDKLWSSCLSKGAHFTCTGGSPFWVKGPRMAHDSFPVQVVKNAAAVHTQASELRITPIFGF